MDKIYITADPHGNNYVFDLTAFYNNIPIEQCFIKTLETTKINNLN